MIEIGEQHPRKLDVHQNFSRKHSTSQFSPGKDFHSRATKRFLRARLKFQGARAYVTHPRTCANSFGNNRALPQRVQRRCMHVHVRVHRWKSMVSSSMIHFQPSFTRNQFSFSLKTRVYVEPTIGRFVKIFNRKDWSREINFSRKIRFKRRDCMFLSPQIA